MNEWTSDRHRFTANEQQLATLIFCIHTYVGRTHPFQLVAWSQTSPHRIHFPIAAMTHIFFFATLRIMRDLHNIIFPIFIYVHTYSYTYIWIFTYFCKYFDFCFVFVDFLRRCLSLMMKFFQLWGPSWRHYWR